MPPVDQALVEIMDKERRRELRNAYKASERERAWSQVGLTREQLSALHAHLERKRADQRCDRTLKRTETWARRQRLEVAAVVEGLGALGGFCDCEVLANVHPDDVV
jgi:ribosomal protein S15P/S13E